MDDKEIHKLVGEAENFFGGIEKALVKYLMFFLEDFKKNDTKDEGATISEQEARNILAKVGSRLIFGPEVFKATLLLEYRDAEAAKAKQENQEPEEKVS